MNDKTILDSLVELRKGSKKNFTQTVDLVVNLKNLDLKKPEDQLDTYLLLPKSKGKKTKVCALVGAELKDQAAKVMDFHVPQTDFNKYQTDKRKTKKLAKNVDFFVAQATIMPKVATAFGRVLGPRAKMPNPKAGCIVPPNANLKSVYDRLQKTVRLMAKKQLVVQTVVGNEEISDDDIKENIKAVYNTLLHNLPQGKNNIKSAYVKLTMGKPFKLM